MSRRIEAQCAYYGGASSKARFPPCAPLIQCCAALILPCISHSIKMISGPTPALVIVPHTTYRLPPNIDFRGSGGSHGHMTLLHSSPTSHCMKFFFFSQVGFLFERASTQTHVFVGRPWPRPASCLREHQHEHTVS
jgi:hypothetical protein